MSEAGRALPGPPASWRIVWRLLVAARRRAVNRQWRTRQIARHRAGKATRNWGAFGLLLGLAFSIAIHGMGAFLIQNSVVAGQRVAAEASGQVIVDDWFLGVLQTARAHSAGLRSPWPEIERVIEPYYGNEAQALANTYGGDAGRIEARLRAAVHEHRLGDLVTHASAAPGLTAPRPLSGLPAILGTAALLLWLLMLVAQGEGADLDMNRRRHPMWEWVLSHPVQPGAMFLAEMLAPIAANPLFWTAPVLPGMVYGFVYGPPLGVLAAVVVGIPATVSAACLGKALEIAALLRFTPRSRGAVLGIMGWIGTSAMTVILLGAFTTEPIVSAVSGALRTVAAAPWPLLGVLLGQRPAGDFSFAAGALACSAFSAAVIAASVGWSVWSARRGLAGPSDRIARPGAAKLGAKLGDGRFRIDPLFKKELLWFRRDRSAVVQALLIPMSMAGVQLFQLRGLLAEARGAWNFLCGAAIVFGTYFIAVLGPKSLASEGSALWIALTWPRGLESLLKAKARLWTLIASAIVGVVLLYAAYAFPADSWRIALVAAAWVVFARSVADKAVTLATVTAPSGETQAVPTGRRWAVYLGTFAFAIGVISGQWSVAVAGVFYSVMTAAAMWQNFRARLPFLYDPWSERPPPPTLMHAMIAITLLIEGGAIFGGVAQTFASPDTLAVTRAIAYAASALCVSAAVAIYLGRRGVSLGDTWRWGTGASSWRVAGWMLLGAAAGLALGIVGREYGALLWNGGWLGDQAEPAVPHLRQASIAMAVFVAPFAEEYLFRGLLYRALDREWGGWRAVAGSAVFFALYHPFVSWLPVGCLGALNAVLFKRTGYLAPSVVAHMVYNAAILA